MESEPPRQAEWPGREATPLGRLLPARCALGEQPHPRASRQPCCASPRVVHRGRNPRARPWGTRPGARTPAHLLAGTHTHYSFLSLVGKKVLSAEPPGPSQKEQTPDAHFLGRSLFYSAPPQGGCLSSRAQVRTPSELDSTPQESHPVFLPWDELLSSSGSWTTTTVALQLESLQDSYAALPVYPPARFPQVGSGDVSSRSMPVLQPDGSRDRVPPSVPTPLRGPLPHQPHSPGTAEPPSDHGALTCREPDPGAAPRSSRGSRQAGGRPAGGRAGRSARESPAPIAELRLLGPLNPRAAGRARPLARRPASGPVA